MSQISSMFLHEVINALSMDIGLERSFYVLFKVLTQFIPAEYLCSNAVNLKGDLHVNLVSFSSGDFAIPKKVHINNYFETMAPYFVDTKQQVYLIGDARSDEKFCSSFQDMDSTNSSFIGMRLYDDNNWSYWMGMRSRERFAFTDEHVEVLLQLKEPMEAIIRKLFHDSLEINQQQLILATERASAQELLRRCPGLTAVMRQVDEVAATNANVLIEGDSGSGKELVAEAVHLASRRVGHPLIKVNCGAIPETLIDAELFGYEKGAFTGAITAHAGYFEQAAGGTLYLDEIGELSPMAQVRLLRVLESREVQRIGSSKRIVVDFRLISATNRDLSAMVDDGTFRADLWYRLNCYPIYIPPLQRRCEDIPVLVRHFCERCAMELGLETGTQPEVPPELVRDLMMREWPGNVRQLRHWIERALIHTKFIGGRVLTPAKEEKKALCGKHEGFSSKDSEHLPCMEEVEKKYILWVLNFCRWKIQGAGSASELLGMKPSTLRSRMKKLGIQRMI